jgi:hypothetical protein
MPQREGISHQAQGHVVRRIACHFADYPSFDQFNIVVLCENAGLDQSMIFVNAESPKHDRPRRLTRG